MNCDSSLARELDIACGPFSCLGGGVYLFLNVSVTFMLDDSVILLCCLIVCLLFTG